MARIHRLSPDAAYRLCMQTAQQVGLPVQLPQVQQGIAQLIGTIYQQLGVFWAVDDTSPYFQQIQQQYPGLTQNTRQIPAPGLGQVPGNGAPVYAPPGQAPQYFQPPTIHFSHAPSSVPARTFFPDGTVSEPFVPQAPQYPAPAAPLPAHAIFPGRPLPDLPGRMPPPPPGMQPGRSGMIPLPGGPVPVNAPISGFPVSDAPPSMTDVPPSPSIILE